VKMHEMKAEGLHHEQENNPVFLLHTSGMSPIWTRHCSFLFSIVSLLYFLERWVFRITPFPLLFLFDNIFEDDAVICQMMFIYSAWKYHQHYYLDKLW